jgi:serine/threonine protein kinase
MSKAGTVMQFKVNPSPSVPLSVSGATAKNVKIPSALANTAASGMMYSFNFRKETKKSAQEAAAAAAAAAAEAAAPSTRKFSSLGVDLPTGPLSLTDFEQLGVLGTGTFGKVKLCMHKSTRQYFCLKILRKQIIYRYHQLNHVQNEKIVLQQVRHPGVVRLFSTFNDADNLYLLIEYAPGGELFTLIRKFGKFPDDVARFYASEIIAILEHLHSKNIVYRDLKPENILLDPHGHVKLADFGFAKQIVDRTWTMCGTPDYMAPELIAMSGHGVAVDYWSLGVLVFEMLVGFPPFTDSTTMGLFAKIREPGKLVIPDHVSPEAQHFIRSLLVVDPSRRLGNIHRETENIRSHPWLRMTDWNAIEARNYAGPIIPPLRSAGDTANFESSDGAGERLPAQPDVELPPDVQKFFEGF